MFCISAFSNKTLRELDKHKEVCNYEYDAIEGKFQNAQKANATLIAQRWSVCQIHNYYFNLSDILDV
jgi:hypothetical protein